MCRVRLRGFRTKVQYEGSIRGFSARFGTKLLAVLLVVWEPLNLAVLVSPVLTTMGTRGAATAAFLFARIVVAGVGIAAGISLWRHDPHGRRLAAIALILSTIAAVITFTTTLLPTNVMPGDRWIYLTGVIAFNGCWLAFLALRAHRFD